MIGSGVGRGMGLPGVALTLFVGMSGALAGGPWATGVVSYDAGSAPSPDFSDPNTALGAPERFTGEDAGFPSAVTLFNGAFGQDEIVTISAGGELTLSLGQPATDDPANPFGVDLIVYGNGFFTGDSQSRVGGLFAEGPMEVWVSENGTDFVSTGAVNDGLFPTQGYLDNGPFDSTPGTIPTDFQSPMDPSLTLDDFLGLTYEEALALYGNSAGGVPIDIAGTGLASANYVRITVPTDAGSSPEVDAVVVVPEPATAMTALLVSFALRRRSSR